MLSLMGFILVAGCLCLLPVIFTTEKTWNKNSEDAPKAKVRDRRLMRFCVVGVVLVVAALIVNLILNTVFE